MTIALMKKTICKKIQHPLMIKKLPAIVNRRDITYTQTGYLYKPSMNTLLNVKIQCLCPMFRIKTSMCTIRFSMKH